MTRNFKTRLLASLIFCISAICLAQTSFAMAADENAAGASGKISVLVGIAPQKYFLERVGRDAVEISVLIRPGADPHSYEPSPAQMRAASKADVYFAAGLTFERAWLSRLSALAPGMSIVDLSDRNARAPEHSGHDLHQDDGGHAWLSPAHVRKTLPLITAALSAKRPDLKAFFQANAESFDREIAALDAKIRALFKDIPEQRRVFMTFHPAWQNFAEDYGLRELSIETEGKEPSTKRVVELIGQARANGISVIFVEPQFPKNAARAIAESIPAELVEANPLAENWAENLLNVAGRMAASFRQAAK